MSQLARTVTPRTPDLKPVELKLIDAREDPLRASVKWFDAKKGYGFLIGPQGQDVFVHYSQIIGDGFKSLEDGESVVYHLERGPKGLLARDVERAPVL